MIDLALKEWAVVCEALVQGEQAFVLRKGGIAEDDGPGRFRLEHDRFAMFPAWEHQKLEGVKAMWRDRVEEFDQEPSELTIQAVADVAGIWQVASRSAFDTLDDLHIWDTPQIDMRFNYKPDRPLYVVALRVARLDEPKVIMMHPDYWGCRSWVPLHQQHHVDDRATTPAMDDRSFERIMTRLYATLD